jgi:transmembrane sensor
LRYLLSGGPLGSFNPTGNVILPNAGRPTGNDQIWARALDFLLGVHEAPDEPEMRAKLDAWLAESEDHAKAYRRAEYIWNLAGALRPADLPIGAARSARDIVVQPIEQSRSPRRRRWRRGAAIAALFAACVLGLQVQRLRLFLLADYVTGTGQRREVQLSDGSKAVLNAVSAVKVGYGTSVREVTILEGETFFNVLPEKDRPFLVRAEALTVTSIGTAFDVELVPDAIRIAIQDGTIRVQYDGPTHIDVRLVGGDRLTVGLSSGAMTRDKIAAAQVASWRTGRLVVDGATIADVIEEIRRNYHGLILLQNKTISTRKVSGVYNLDDPIAALRAVVAPFSGSVRRLTPYVLIVSGS